MLQQRPVTTLQHVNICDRCGKEMQRDAIDGEWSERLTISFRAGYGSVFGDGNIVECDLCQHCIKDLLERYLRIIHDDSFDPKHKPQVERYRIYQDYQLCDEAQKTAVWEEFKRLARAHSKKLEEREQQMKIQAAAEK